MVPGEGIEPPTFGLQNRCSTAELNRQLIDARNPLYRVCLPLPGADGAGRRQISELSGEGYWHESSPGKELRIVFQPRLARGAGRGSWRPLDGLRGRKPCPGHGDDTGVL